MNLSSSTFNAEIWGKTCHGAKPFFPTSTRRTELILIPTRWDHDLKVLTNIRAVNPNPLQLGSAASAPEMLRYRSEWPTGDGPPEDKPADEYFRPIETSVVPRYSPAKYKWTAGSGTFGFTVDPAIDSKRSSGDGRNDSAGSLFYCRVGPERLPS